MLKESLSKKMGEFHDKLGLKSSPQFFWIFEQKVEISTMKKVKFHHKLLDTCINKS